jgi:hypothetical protein
MAFLRGIWAADFSGRVGNYPISSQRNERFVERGAILTQFPALVTFPKGASNNDFHVERELCEAHSLFLAMPFWFTGAFGMQLLAPDILEEARTLSPFISGVGLAMGFLLWLLGGRTHRFWLAMSITLGAGLLGLVYGKQCGMQPLVAGLLLAISAGTLALSLVRILLFATGGLAALSLIQAIAPAWDEPLAIFLVGGLIGVLLYRFWIAAFSSLVGSLLMAYSALALLDRLHRVDSVAWTQKNGPLLNWGCVSLIVMGVLVQFLLARHQHRKFQPMQEPEEAIPLAALRSRPAKPARSFWWAWGEKLIQRRAG